MAERMAAFFFFLFASVQKKRWLNMFFYVFLLDDAGIQCVFGLNRPQSLEGLFEGKHCGRDGS